MPLSVAAGADYPTWIIQRLRDSSFRPAVSWIDGLAMLRYDEASFSRRELLYD